jgi:hypothetical protein
MTNKLPEAGAKYSRYTNKNIYPGEIEIIATRLPVVIFGSVEDVRRQLSNPEYDQDILYTLSLIEFHNNFQELPSETEEEPSYCKFCVSETLKAIDNLEAGKGTKYSLSELEQAAKDGTLLERKDEVQKAKEGLRSAIRESHIDFPSYHAGRRYIELATQNLLDALDNQNLRDKENSLSGGEAKSNLEQAFKDYKNGNIKTHNSVDELIDSVEEKPQSIWRSVEELPDNNCDILIKVEGEIELQPFSAKYGFANKENTKEYCTLTDYITENEQLKQDFEALKAKVNQLTNPFIGNLEMGYNSPERKGYQDAELINNKKEKK